MSPSPFLVAQVTGAAPRMSAHSLVAAAVAVGVQAHGRRCLDLAEPVTWSSAPVSRLGALPDGTPSVVHLGTGVDTPVSCTHPPGPVMIIDHGHDESLPLPPAWYAQAVHGLAATPAAADRLARSGVTAVEPMPETIWHRLIMAIAPDPRERRMLAQHAGPHATACGPLSSAAVSGPWVAATSALVQHLRPDATVALLGTGPAAESWGARCQVAELGLRACQVGCDATPGQLVAHLESSRVYLASEPLHEDTGLPIARALGVPVVCSDPTADGVIVHERGSIASLAAAIDVGLDRAVVRPSIDADDTWLAPLMEAAG